MGRSVQAGLLSIFILGAVAGAPTPTFAQAQPPAAPAGPQASTPRAQIPGYNDVVATVSEGNVSDKVTKGEVITFLSRYPIPAAEDRDQLYRNVVDSLVNTKLLTMFLNRQKIAVDRAKVDEEISRVESSLKQDKQDLETALKENNIDLKDMRAELENRIRWSEYVKAKATDAELQRYLNDNKDLFSGTQVRASHILLRVDPDAPSADKEKVKQKLLGIKAQLDANKMSFAEAANKYSEDPANAGTAGGDLDYITLRSGFITEFTDVAFRLKKGSISGPVETPYGFHLIQVTDRKEGKLPDFEQIKPAVVQYYAGDLQKNIVTEERKQAKIDVKPMPKDLFPAAPAAPAGTPAAGAATPKTSR
ncbi:Foldase protein PrsA 1 precursor [Aquisphaera giovannonii]|uniref:Foldase protein PrsA 1 n=1 Tax=Aquisphaera giovannonii TaxID=406548 RepID=A0A5B9VYF3_9BACT|nr:peptidylprolyl isomerase [Aquisphaera giovannonii]QEH33338.1 Foldase protein PrsA 1 precursor [Aquisphaera giovannonii]